MPELLTVPEVAERLRIGRRAAYEAIARGEIPGAVKIGRTIRVSSFMLGQWLHGTGHNGTEDDELTGASPLINEQEAPDGEHRPSG
jgi:excisionase family DNA binding protein